MNPQDIQVGAVYWIAGAGPFRIDEVVGDLIRCGSNWCPATQVIGLMTEAAWANYHADCRARDIFPADPVPEAAR